MASLTSQSIAGSYEQLLHVDRDGGGNGTTLVDVKDGDNGTTFALKLAQFHAEIRGTTGTGATGAGKLNLSTAELTVVDNDVLGRIDFLAPLESSGTDAVLAGASIWGEAEDTFAADNNSTALVFATNTSAAATERMRIGSNGTVTIDQNSNAIALNIDHEGTNQQAINVSAANTSGDAINIDADSLTTANALRVASNSSDTNTRNVMLVHNDHASATGATALKVQQDSTGAAIDSGGNIFIEQTPYVNNSAHTLIGLGGNAGLHATSSVGASGELGLAHNLKNTGSAWVTISTDEHTMYTQAGGNHNFYAWASASAGATVSEWTTSKVAIFDSNSRISLSNNDASGAVGTTLFGYNAGLNIVSGAVHNTFIGHEVADASLTNAADYNTGVGGSALGALTSGYSNVAVGFQALVSNTDGFQNTAIGTSALYYNVGTDNNTALGDQAGMYTTGASNTYVGQSAGKGASGAEANNVGVGKDALLAVTTGSGNVAIGKSAADSLVDGNYNVNIGLSAGHHMTDAGNNVIIGNAAGSSDVNFTTGDQCVLIGSGADVSTGDAQNQTAIGYDCNAVGNNSVTLGNTSVTAVYMAQDGATGDGATMYAKSFELNANSGGGHPITKMTNHVADSEGPTFQFRKSRNTTVGSHTIVQNNDQLGNLTWYASDGNSWERAGVIQCLIDGTPGDGDLPTEMLFGVSEDGNATPTIRMTMAPAGTISGDFNDTSDVGLKENIKSISDGLSIVKQMNPVSFDWKQKSRGSNSGFIAQEIEKLLPNDVNGEDYITPKDGEQAENMGKSINVTGIVAHLVKAVQELTAKVEALEAK